MSKHLTFLAPQHLEVYLPTSWLHDSYDRGQVCASQGYQLFVEPKPYFATRLPGVEVCQAHVPIDKAKCVKG